MDIAINTEADPAPFGFDWMLKNGDLAADATLKSRVVVSIMSDGLAAADDELPDNSGNRRGWWGDLALDGGAPDLIGSLLWLLSRAKAVTRTAAQAQRYVRNALQWMLDDGVASALDIATEWASREQLRIIIAIARDGANGATINQRYEIYWKVLPS